MDTYNPSELVAVCESILEDGELSGDELYHLAEWLNDHREACIHWPGNLLVKPLQEVWADGKLTKTEMRQIGRLLVQIRKEWAKRRAEEAFELAADLVRRIANNIDLSRPLLPSVPFITHVKSHTEVGVRYDVDLSGPTCSCPNWRAYRHSLPPGHLTRCCKHVFDAYSLLEPEAGWPGWLGAFFNLASPPHPQQDWMVLQIGQGFILASTAPTGWANVFVEEGGSYDRFGYNIFENRWAYGIEPTGSKQIRRAIVNAMKR